MNETQRKRGEEVTQADAFIDNELLPYIAGGSLKNELTPEQLQKLMSGMSPELQNLVRKLLLIRELRTVGTPDQEMTVSIALNNFPSGNSPRQAA